MAQRITNPLPFCPFLYFSGTYDFVDLVATLDEIADLTPEEMPVARTLIAIIAMRERGEMPRHYTGSTTCKHCGPVPIWEGCPPAVLGCPWCFNRMRGLPIPTVASETR